MTEIEELRSEIVEILELVAKSEDISDFTITYDDKALLANGFLSDFFLGEVKNLKTNETHKVAIKKSFKNEVRRQRHNLNGVFYNENTFYSKIFPKFDQFQREKGVKEPFDSIPKYYCGSNEEKKEFIALQNIKDLGYEIRERDSLIDDDLAKYIFALYGKYHAISFALRDQRPEEFQELTNEVFDFWTKESDNKEFYGFMDDLIKSSFQLLDPVKNSKLLEDCKKYYEGKRLFNKTVTYNGDHLVLTHGDCWSNNMMFKMVSGKLHSMKLIDFQLVKAATPVFDLSYFFYVGGSQELFDKLDDYLKVYHDSLSNFIKELGSDPEKLYTLDQLKDEWKEYAKFGVFMSFSLVKVKLMKQSDMETVRNSMEKETMDPSEFTGMQVDQEVYAKRISDIIVHAYEYGVFK